MVQVVAAERGADGAATAAAGGRGATGVNVDRSRYVVSGADGAGVVGTAR